MKNKIDITPAALSALAQGDMANFLAAATPGGIERQEAAGQQELVSNFSRLPKGYGWNTPFPTEILERLGFKIGESEDDLFVKVTPPEGWRLEATDHSMHSDILDQQGRIRGSVFYKAAFYDRKASFGLAQRYQQRNIYLDGATYAEGTVQATAMDTATGEILFSKEAHARKGEYYKVLNTDEQECRDYLDQRFIDWKNPEAFW